MLCLLDNCEAIEQKETLDPQNPKRYVVGIDIDIRPHNKKFISEHPMSNRIKLLEGSSTDDEIVQKVPLDFIQLHGKETPERVHEVKVRYKLPVIKAIGISEVADLDVISLFKDVADQLLIDAKSPSSSVLPGGNGLNFDWKLLKNFEFRCPWLLAGGLNSENAAEAIALTGATQLDLSSGVEKAPGLKDDKKISLFMSAI